MKKFKRLVAVLVCAMMMTGCGAGGKGQDATTKKIVDAAKTHLGVEEYSKDKMIKYYEGDAKHEADEFRNKVIVQDEEIIKIRKENGTLQGQNKAKEMIIVSTSTEDGICSFSVIKLDKMDCQNSFDQYKGTGNLLYSDDKLVVYDAHKNHCSFAAKIDDEHLISGQVNWSYVGETTEQSECTKNLVAFFDAIGAPNPIAIVEQNADKVE